jgi:tetratricopeptide (TPR) repeat protein
MVMSAPAFPGALPKPASSNADAQKLIDQAWELFRTDLDPKNHMILTELARYYWEYGNNLPKQTEAQQDKLVDLYEKGLDYADQSLDVKETVGGHYWFAVNRAASKEFSSIVTQAAAFPSIYSHSEKVGELDEDYYYGASGRLWSEVLVRVPKAVVELVGWNVQDAVDDINESIKKEPGYLNNHLYKARFINSYFGKKDEALELLDHVLKQDAKTLLPGEETSNRVAQRKARELWKEITGKDYPDK